MTKALTAQSATMATGRASVGQDRAALAVTVGAALVTLALYVFAGTPGPVMPGFILLHQTALIVIYTFTAWLLFSQYLRSRLVTLLVAAGGTFFTAVIVALQLLSIPGGFAAGRLLGSSSATTTWLWTFWHMGPPVWALAVAAILVIERELVVSAAWRRSAALASVVLALALAAACAAVATLLLAHLPLQVAGDDYSSVTTSGVGPAVMLFTLAALGAMLLATRHQRSTLDVWIIASLALLFLDDLLTLSGGTRGSLGWIAGRILALASAGAVVWAYLHEAESLRDRAEAAFAELSIAEAKLHHAQKMEAVGQLTGGIAHDFNNLLMIVTSSLDMIRRKPNDPARVTKIAEAGLQATERGALLTRQLLSFARRQSLRPETVNPNSQIITLESAARRAIGDTVSLSLALDPGAHPVRIDVSEFETAVMNLVTNARDALPPQGGTVTISSRNAVLRDQRPAEGLRQGEYLVITVADDGAGMPPAIAARAFEPFFTTKDFGKGAGLGLSQVYGFARAAGGEAVIQTAPGRGTRVELWLPRFTAGAPAQPVEVRENNSPLRPAQAGEVVLAVEDEPDVLAAVVENLADLGYQVLTARDAAEALEQIRTAPRVDLLFSDIVMPGGMNGVQLASEATRMRPNIRILLTSGYSNQAFEGADALPSHVEMLPKPYRRAELASRLQLVMRAA